MYPILAIDTAGPLTSVALKSSSGLSESFGRGTSLHNEELSIAVQEVLEALSVAAVGLGAIVIGSGPGSFTGLRIGHAFAKGLALAAGCPLYSASTFLAAAYEYRSAGNDYWVIADARREEFFCGRFVRIGENLIQLAGEIDTIKKQGFVETLEESPASVIDIYGTAGIGIGPSGHIARELISVVEGGKALAAATSAFELSQVSPLYVRAIAAKTIAERAR